MKAVRLSTTVGGRLRIQQSLLWIEKKNTTEKVI